MAGHESNRGWIWLGRGLEVAGAGAIVYEIARALNIVKWVAKVAIPLLGTAAASYLVPGTLGLLSIIGGATIINSARRPSGGH